MKSKRTPLRRHMLVALFGATVGMGAMTLTPVSASAESGKANQAPKAQIQQDGPMLEVVLPARRSRGVERLAFRLTSLDTGAVVEGETGPPQIKLVLAFDQTYAFSFRALQRNEGWSEWSEPVTLTAPAIEAYPFTVQAVGTDGGISLRWADTEADAYRIDVRNHRGRRVARETVTGTEATIDGLRNGQTYRVSIRSRYGDRLTSKSPAIPVTPNDGAPITINGRDYVTEPLTGPTGLTVRTAITGATERISKVRVRVAPEGLPSRTDAATFDPAATATTGIRGAWVTPELSVSPFDHELITIVKGERIDGNRIILASSMQTWLLGNVDAFAPGASEFTRVGTIR